MDDIIPIGTQIPYYGRIGAIRFADGERTYVISGLRGDVALLPEDVVRRLLTNRASSPSPERPE